MNFYKPKILIAGILIFAISILTVGYMVGSEKYIDNVWYIVLPMIGIFLGEGLICETASYKINSPTKPKTK